MRVLNYDDTLTNRIMQELLKNINALGWNEKALAKALETLDLPLLDARLIMEGDPMNLIQLFDVWINEQVFASIEREAYQDLKVHEKIKYLLSLKFNAMHPFKLQLLKGLSILKRPSSVRQSISLLLKTTDTLWYEAGDQSTDFNYYTKRAILSLVYLRVFMSWIKPSTGVQEIDGLIERALEDAYHVSQLKNRAQGVMRHLFRVFKQ